MRFQTNHDLHIHTGLSLCSGDPAMNPESVLRFGTEHGYEAMCLTDHYWDERCAPAPNDFYEKQDTAHVMQNFPLPAGGEMRYCFGCETDFWGGDRLGISAARMDQFDFIIVPPNHFHMNCDRSVVDTPEKTAVLLCERIEELTKLSLPWEKIGLAHLTCSLTGPGTEWLSTINAVDVERMKESFRFFAAHGAGIELNADCFSDRDGIWQQHRDEVLRLYVAARDVGCKFYCGSDAHHPQTLTYVQSYISRAVEALELTEQQRYRIPLR